MLSYNSYATLNMSQSHSLISIMGKIYETYYTQEICYKGQQIIILRNSVLY